MTFQAYLYTINAKTGKTRPDELKEAAEKANIYSYGMRAKDLKISWRKKLI